MFLRSKIKLDDDVYSKAAIRAKELGYSTINEYIESLIEADIQPSADEMSQDMADQRLRGLGYL